LRAWVGSAAASGSTRNRWTPKLLDIIAQANDFLSKRFDLVGELNSRALVRFVHCTNLLTEFENGFASFIVGESVS
jgi:hypothetical protein